MKIKIQYHSVAVFPLKFWCVSVCPKNLGFLDA